MDYKSFIKIKQLCSLYLYLNRVDGYEVRDNDLILTINNRRFMVKNAEKNFIIMDE